MPRNKKYTNGLQDIERVFESLSKLERKERRDAWLEKRKAQRNPNPQPPGDKKEVI